MRSVLFDLRPGSRWRLHDRDHVVERHEAPGTVILRCLATEQTFRMSVSEVAWLAMRGKFRATDTQPIPPKLQQPYFNLGRLTDAQLRRIERRLAYVNAAKVHYPLGPKHPAMAATIDQIARRLNDPKPPSRHTVYRWLIRYVRAGYDSTVFALDAGASRRRRTGLTLEVHARLQEVFLEKAAAKKDPTVRGLYDDVVATVAAELGYPKFKSLSGETMLLPQWQDARLRRNSSPPSQES